MHRHSSPPFHILLTKIVYLIVLCILIFLYYIDDYFIDETAGVETGKKKSVTRVPRKGGYCDVKHLLEPAAPKPPGMMDLYDPPPFDMGYSDILINKVNNRTPDIDIYIQEILRKEHKEPEDQTPVAGIVSYSEAQMDLSKPPPFNNVPGDVLINEVNNTDEIEEVDVNVIFTMPFLSRHYQFLHFVTGIIERLPSCRCYPPGYAMSPYDPPPFNVGTADVLFNEVNNRDVRDDIDIYELLDIQPKKFLRLYRAPKGTCNKKPSDQQ